MKRTNAKCKSFLLMILMTLHAVNCYPSVIITEERNETQYFPAVMAAFGPLLTAGLNGYLLNIKNDGCRLSDFANFLSNVQQERPELFPGLAGTSSKRGKLGDHTLIALISRGNCSFDQKIYNAQLLGCSAVVIYERKLGTWAGKAQINGKDNETFPFPKSVNAFSGLIHMTAGRHGESIKIPSAFTSYNSAMKLIQFDQDKKVIQVKLLTLGGLFIMSENGKKLQMSLLSDLVIFFMVGIALSSICGMISAASLIYHRYELYLRIVEREKKNRLPPEDLAKIPTVALSTGHFMESNNLPCAICLEDMPVGTYVRDLCCKHYFHIECVDDWFLKSHRTCPTCRQEIIINGVLNTNAKRRAESVAVNISDAAIQPTITVSANEEELQLLHATSS